MQSNQIKAVEELISNLLSENAEIRKSSENQVDSFFQTNLNSVCDAFLRAILHSSSEQVRMMGIIVLRKKLFKSSDIFDKLTPENKSNLKQFLLKNIQNESQKRVRQQLALLCSEVADLEVPRGAWNNLLPELEKMTKSPNSIVRGDAIYIFGTICSFENIRKNNEQTFLSLIVKGLIDSDMDVRQKSLDAGIGLFFMRGKDVKLDETQFVTALLNFVRDVLKLNEPNRVIELFEQLIEFVSVTPKSIQPHFEGFIKLMSNAAMSTVADSNVRILALEFLVVLAEFDNGVYRRSASFVQAAFMSALSLMVEFDDNPEWETKLLDEEEENEMYSEGEMAMDRLAQSFGSNRVLSVAIPLVAKFLESNDWKRRLVGLISISQMAESIDNTHAEKFIRTVSNYYTDNHPRVVFSAIHCIGQMCEDFSPDIQKKYHSLILPPLVKILKDSKSPKIQSHAGAALVNFTENVEEDVMRPYIKEMLEILFDLMQHSHQIVKEQVVTVVACLASLTPKELKPALMKFVDPLYTCFARTEDMTSIFRPKCLEALTFVGEEIEPMQFSNVAHELMKTTLSDVQNLYKHHEEYFDFILQAWIRLSKTLQSGFARYLPAVMPLIFKTAKEENISKDAIVESDKNSNDNEEEIYDEEDMCEEDDDYNAFGDSSEVSTAMCALSTLPFELGMEYYPYMAESISVAKMKLDYWGETNIRVYSARTFSALFSVVVSALKANKIQMKEVIICLHDFIKKLFESYQDEKEYPAKKAILQSITALLEQNEEVSSCYLTQNNNTKQILTSLFNLIGMSKKRYLKIIEKSGNTDNDEEELQRYEAVKAMETEIIYKVTEVFGMVLRVMKENAINTFNEFSKQIMLLLSSKDTDLLTQKAALLITVDAILYIPIAMQNFSDFLLHLYLNLVRANDIDLKQTAIYGLGLVSEKYPQVFSQKGPEVLKTCMEMFALLKNAENAEHISLRDNVASCYGRVIFSCSEQINLAESFPVWLEMLPLKSDLAEIKTSTDLLCRVLQSGNKSCIGNDLKHLPRILDILGKSFRTVPPSELQKKCFLDFVANIKTLPSETQNKLANELTDDAKQMIMSYKG